jgi:glutathione S-transferase
MGRHEIQDILAIANKDLKSLSDYLGTNEFFFNNKVSSLDIVSFAVVGNILCDGGVTEVGNLARKHPNLVAHVERVRKLAWS